MKQDKAEVRRIADLTAANARLHLNIAEAQRAWLRGNYNDRRLIREINDAACSWLTSATIIYGQRTEEGSQ